MNNGTIILLNGTSSSGKSSLAKALQEVLDQPFLHIDGDYFWQMYPDCFFTDKPDEIYRSWRSQFLPACYQSVAVFVQAGLNVIIDEVLTKPLTLTWLQDVLAEFEVVFVGLHCGLEELERRERQRGNRKVGLARFQYPNIHIHGQYDIEVSTEENDVVACALQIAEQLKSGREFNKFQQAKEQPLPI
jgi:chloramphenicol 3-O phosphotransferase